MLSEKQREILDNDNYLDYPTPLPQQWLRRGNFTRYGYDTEYQLYAQNNDYFQQFKPHFQQFILSKLNPVDLPITFW